MARWVGVGTQRPRAGVKPATLQSRSTYHHTNLPLGHRVPLFKWFTAYTKLTVQNMHHKALTLSCRSPQPFIIRTLSHHCHRLLASRSVSFFFGSTFGTAASVSCLSASRRRCSSFELLSVLRARFPEDGSTMSLTHADLLVFDLWTSRNSLNSTLLSNCNRTGI